MTLLRKGDWVLVADGEKALFLRNDLDAQSYDLNVVRIESQDNPPAREQAEGAPGRRAGAAGAAQSAIPETDYHQLAKDRFAEELAEILNRQALRDAFQRIVIAAPPGVLGALRPKLHAQLQERVIAEIPKTLTNHPIDAIERLLKAELA